MKARGEGRLTTVAAGTAVARIEDERRGRHTSCLLAMLGALSLALLLAWWLCPGIASGAQRCEEEEPGGAIYEVSVNTDQKASPATDGELVAWGERVSGTWGIWVKRLRSDGQRGWYVKEQVASCAFKPCSISLAGNTVVWQEGTSPNATIWACELCGDPWVLAQGAVGEPAAAEGYAVWVDFARDAGGDIVGTSMWSGDFGIVDIYAGAGAQRRPAVSDGVAVWQDARDGDWDVWACALHGGSWLGCRSAAVSTRCHPLTPGTPTVVCDANGDQTNPAIWQSIVAWQDTRNGDSDIWAAWASGSACKERSASVRTACSDPLEIVTGPVCTADGPQTTPTLSSPVVFWADKRDGDSDIRAYDLASQESGIVCDETGDQVAPSAGGNAVVWLDGRAGGDYMDVYGADTWTTEETSPFAPSWTDEEVITLFLSVFYDLGVFDEVRFSTDGGETWGEWQELSDVVKLPLPDGEGTYEISLMLRGSSGEFGPVTFVVHVDKHAPKAKTLAPVKVHKGKKTAVRLRIRDNMSPRADAIVKIKDRNGEVVQRIGVEDLATGKKVAARFACSLPRGTYKCTVRARDVAGNVQRKASTVRLGVR